MSTAGDKDWAQKYVNGPLTAPGPSDETGPGTHFNSTFAKTFKQQGPDISSDSGKSSSPGRNRVPRSLSHGRTEARTDRSEKGSTHNEASTDNNPRGHRAQRSDGSSSRSSIAMVTEGTGRRRGSSLTSRFPGDKSHLPLEIIRRDTLRAQRSPHLRKNHLPGADSIDRLDSVFGSSYHHEGPYDAALLARNTSAKSSPLQAIVDSNREALRATPKGNIKDAVERHRPLDGVAVVPPGMKSYSGEQMHYEEGSNMMIYDGADYKRWPGLEYHPDDIKGKGEPSFSIERALKAQKLASHRRVTSEGNHEYEMLSPSRRASTGGRHERGNAHASGTQLSYSDWENMRREQNHKDGHSEGLKKRFNSLRRKPVPS
ncbi:MAG: hypothetical protein M1825_000684 [Sarcosagium campestre]|nr:MAG: hypothetical protein M1825_000684 [Sarcosagium campestre]